ncbi:MAG: S-layer family protein [Leptolyngbyaceae cyanobacterium SL_7_1]|nr:S-layer family protein [Leptolyngbyaceae cyanobacterium SL_7_1]
MESGITTAGNPGNIRINAEAIELQNQAAITATSAGGDGGNIRLRVAEALTIQGDSRVITSAQGVGGNLDVVAGGLLLRDRGRLETETTSRQGGEIEIEVAESVILRRQSAITTSALDGGDGGRINIDAPNGFVLGVLVENSDIIAAAIQGDGGRAEATAVGVFGFREFIDRPTPQSDFTASSEFGQDGVEIIETREDALQDVPPDFLRPSIAQGCEARGVDGQSEFVITGSGGLPSPAAGTAGSGVWEDLRPIAPTMPTELDPEQRGNGAPIETPIVEAQGWVRNQDGAIRLVAMAPQVTPYSGGGGLINCPVPEDAR